MNRCFIFGALKVSRLPIKPESGDFIIAADKGYDTALSLGIDPDLAVGDFDSLNRIPDAENVVTLPVRKDLTDVGYAVEKGFEHGCGEFILYGAVGGALDHTFANVAIAHDIARRGAKALLIGEEYSFTVLHESSMSFNARESCRISVFALGGIAEGVTIRGLSYEVEDFDVACTDHIGVSNAFIGKTAEISVRKGYLLVVWQTE
jgi:thiamine pyrophosphokinase